MRACNLTREIQASRGSAGPSRFISRVEGSARKPITASAFSGKTISSIGRTPRSNARLSEVVAMRRTYHADLRLGNDSGPLFPHLPTAYCLLLTAYYLLPSAFSVSSVVKTSFPGAVFDSVSLVDCISRGVRSTEVVKASGSILFRNVKIEPAEKGRQFELASDVAVKSG